MRRVREERDPHAHRHGGRGVGDVSLEGAKAAVEFDPAKTSLPELKRAVERAGFKAP